MSSHDKTMQLKYVPSIILPPDQNFTVPGKKAWILSNSFSYFTFYVSISVSIKDVRHVGYIS